MRLPRGRSRLPAPRRTEWALVLSLCTAWRLRRRRRKSRAIGPRPLPAAHCRPSGGELLQFKFRRQFHTVATPPVFGTVPSKKYESCFPYSSAGIHAACLSSCRFYSCRYTDPLCSFHLVKTKADEHFFFYSMHHAVARPAPPPALPRFYPVSQCSLECASGVHGALTCGC